MSKRQLPWFLRRHFERKKRRDEVRKRDGDDCWRCGKPMRFGEPFNRGKAATIEHVVALSQGGTWAVDNLRLCHKGCNKHLGTKSPEQKERMRLRRI